MRLLLSFALASALTVGWQQELRSQAVVESPVKIRQREYRAALVVAIEANERALTRELSWRGRAASSDSQVNFIRVSLASQRYELAQVDNKSAASREQLCTRIEICNSDFERVTRLLPRRGASASANYVAQRRLANARYRLALFDKRSLEVVQQLKLIAELCEKELRQLEELSPRGAAQDREMHRAQCRLAYARFRLNLHSDRVNEAMQQLRSAVAACQHDVDQLEAVYRRGAVGDVDLRMSRMLLLGNKTRLAILEEKPEAAREHLGALVAAREWYLKAIKSEPLITEREIKSVEADIAAERVRLALASDANTPLRKVLDNPFTELDSGFIPTN